MTTEVVTTDFVEVPVPDTSLLVSQDNAPMDNIYVEKQQRLLTEPLYSSWAPPEQRSFLALANVGLFFAERQPPLAPDVMLSLDVPPVADRREDDHRSYFCWVVGKMPDVVIEIVSDRRGGEDSDKLNSYRRQHIPYYVIYDPGECLHAGVLRAFALRGLKYDAIDPRLFADVGLGLTLWDGVHEGDNTQWLRWCDADGRLISTGRERADAAEEKNRRLMERLRQLGETVD
jgi:Uma2 family endonuclease